LYKNNNNKLKEIWGDGSEISSTGLWEISGKTESFMIYFASLYEP
jgi:hypothetical protein